MCIFHLPPGGTLIQTSGPATKPLTAAQILAASSSAAGGGTGNTEPAISSVVSGLPATAASSKLAQQVDNARG